jgi:hypothetical protein
MVTDTRASHGSESARTIGVALLLMLTGIVFGGCGGDSSPGGSDDPADGASDGSGSGDIGTGDVALDGSEDIDDTADSDADAADSADSPDSADTDVAPPDVEPEDVADADASDDTTDVDAGSDDVADTADGSDVVDADTTDTGDTPDVVDPWPPGRLPLADWVTCTENSDCPNGTGNCITELVLNRELPDGRNRVPMSEVFPGLTAPGVCSLNCAGSEALCETLAFRIDDTPWTCQLAYDGPAAYPSDDIEPLVFPFDSSLSYTDLGNGPAFGALCRPPFHRSTSYSADFCQACSTEIPCATGSVCMSSQPANPDWTEGYCLPDCSASGQCPQGFNCNGVFSDGLLGGSPEAIVCQPEQATCGSCRDDDGDERGVGRCAAGDRVSAEDCDDTDSGVYFAGSASTHAFPGRCGIDSDANCNGLSDAAEQVATSAWGAFHCAFCGDTCSGSAPQASSFVCSPALDGGPARCEPQCDDPSAWVDCNGILEDGCETSITDPSRLYVPDCDGDGFGRAVTRPTFSCSIETTPLIAVATDGGPPRACTSVPAIEQPDGTWGDDCDDDVSTTNPGADELCDGIDNTCDGVVDPPEVAGGGQPCVPAAGTTAGQCAVTARYACGGDGEVICVPGAAIAEVCDGIDNDCDGAVDDFAASTPENRIGESCRATPGAGDCGTGQLQCRTGALVCIEGVPPSRDEPGDGVDADCDGFDGDLERAIFVRIGGATASSATLGQRTNPVGSLLRAWELAFARLRSGQVPVEQIYIATGDYTLPHAMDFGSQWQNVRVLGGYTSTGDVWTPSTGRSTIEFTSICSCNFSASITAGVCTTPVCASLQAAVSYERASSVLLSNLTLVVPVQSAGFGHTIGVRCSRAPGSACSGLTLRDVSINVEGGAPGAPHSTAAANGANGGAGGTAAGFTPGAGGSSSCGAQGGAGGGLRSTSESCLQRIGSFTVLPGTVTEGLPGAAGLPSGQGGAGGAGATRDGDEQCNEINNDATDGRAGQSRTSRGTGGGGGNGGASTRPTLVGSGTTGFSGLSGGGGGGGGSGGLSTWTGGTFFEPAGSGGGAGGCGGTAGLGGRAGGSAIGLWIDDNSSSPVLTSVEVRVGPGGAGSAGQAGGAGGTGGAFGTYPAEGNTGGAGGHGAGGGGGGGGGGGWSIGVARFPAVPVAVVPTIGAAGAGGAAGAAGPGNSTPLFSQALSTVPDTAASINGLPGTAGAAGGSAQFCNLSTSAVSGEVFCR